MLLPARRLAHAATRRPRILHRFASTSTSTSTILVLREKLRAVKGLETDPSVLPEVVTSFLARPEKEGTSLRFKLLNLLCQNPSVGTRWDDARRILDRYPDQPFQIAVQPSHAEAVEKFVPLPPERVSDTWETAKWIMQVRYADAPFIALEHVLRIGEIVTPQRAVGYWLSFLPEHLVRLTTNWDHPLFDVDAARQGIVDQLRELEEQMPKLVAAPDIQKTLMWAYGAARVAPDDAMRHWSAVLAHGAPLSLRLAEHALASTRTLDSLERVWAQLQPLIPRTSKIPGTLSMLDVFYAQHLIRLGAYDAALAVAKNYPLHPYLAWLLNNDDAQRLARAVPDTQKFSVIHVARNRKLADTLARNGLDKEDIMHVLSVNSHFTMRVRKSRTAVKTVGKDEF